MPQDFLGDTLLGMSPFSLQGKGLSTWTAARFLSSQIMMMRDFEVQEQGELHLDKTGSKKEKWNSIYNERYQP